MHRQKLQRTIIALAFILLLSVLILSSRYISEISENNLLSQSSEKLNDFNSLRISAVNRYFSYFKQSAERLAIQLSEQGGEPFVNDPTAKASVIPTENLALFLKGFSARESSIDAFFVTPDGLFSFEESGVRKTYDISKTDYFSAAKSSENPLIYYTSQSPVSSLPSFIVLSPVFNESEVCAFVCLSVSSSVVSELFLSSSSGYSFHLFLSPDGNYLSGDDEERYPYDQVFDSVLSGQSSGENDGCLYSSGALSDELFAGDYSPVFISFFSRDLLSGQIQNTRRMVIYAIAVLGTVIATVFFVIFLATRKHRKELKYFSEAMTILKKYVFVFSPSKQKIYFSDLAKRDLSLNKYSYTFAQLSNRLKISKSEISLIEKKLKSPTDKNGSQFVIRFSAHCKYFKIFFKPTSKHSSDIIGIFEDVSKYSESENYSNKDFLTKLFNREAFVKEVEKALLEKPSSQHALFFIDIDNFGMINKTYGYLTGDMLLKKVSVLLKKLCEAKKSIIGRVGGDEFYILISDFSSTNEIRVFAKEICTAFSSLTVSREKHRYISCSIGISTYPSNGHTVHELIKIADNALYKSKTKEGSYYTIYDCNGDSFLSPPPAESRNKYSGIAKKLFESQSSSYDGKNIEHLLETGKKNGYFILFLQPKVSASSGKVLGAEVLTRYSSPELGFIMPGVFIPLLEKGGYITDFDLHIFEKSLQTYCQLLEKGINIPMSINQSVSTITSPLYIERITSFLEHCGKDFSASNITIEITERGFYTEMRSIAKTLSKLRALGFKVSIDDFGSGYTTLSLLNDVVVDEIKIDKGCTESYTKGSAKGKAILGSIIDMAHALGISVVAEGIEKKEQADFLLTSKCDMLQGFYFSRPISINDFCEKYKNDFSRKK